MLGATIAGAGRTAVSSVATGCISWLVAVGGTTGLAGRASLCVLRWETSSSEWLEFRCVSAYCFLVIYSLGMDCRTDNLCGYVDIWFKWSFSLEFLLAFQEYSISDFEFVFLGSVSSVMVTLQFLFVLVSLCLTSSSMCAVSVG